MYLLCKSPCHLLVSCDNTKCLVISNTIVYQSVWALPLERWPKQAPESILEGTDGLVPWKGERKVI